MSGTGRLQACVSRIGVAKRLKCSTWSLSTQFYPTKRKRHSYRFFFVGVVIVVAAVLLRLFRWNFGRRPRHTHTRQHKLHVRSLRGHWHKFNDYEIVQLILFHANIKHCLFRCLFSILFVFTENLPTPDVRQHQHTFILKFGKNAKINRSASPAALYRAPFRHYFNLRNLIYAFSCGPYLTPLRHCKSHRNAWEASGFWLEVWTSLAVDCERRISFAQNLYRTLIG